jgi:lambda family phage tail tape measure protein
MANIARLGVVLGLNTAEFQSGLAGAMKSLDKLKPAILAVGTAALAAGAGLAYLTKQSIDNMDALAKQSQMAGVTVESLSALSYAANLAGVSQEDLTASMVKLSKGMSDAKQGTGDALKAFEALGINVKELANADDAMPLIAEQFEKFEDGANKTALAVALFGKAGAQMIPLLNSGAEGLKQMADEAKKLHLVVSTQTAKAAEEFNDSLTRLNGITQGLINKFTEGLLPTLNNITKALFNSYVQSDKLRDEMTQLAGLDMVEWAENFAIGLAHVADVAVAAVRTVIALANSIRAISADIGLLYETVNIFRPSNMDKLFTPNESMFKAWKDQLAERQKLAETFTDSFLRINDKNATYFTKTVQQAVKDARILRQLGKIDDSDNWDKMGKPKAPDMITTDTAAAKAAEKEAEKQANMLKAASLLSGEYERERDHAIEMLKIREQLAGMTNNERKIQEAVNEVLNSTSKKLQEISDKREAAAGRGANAEVLEEYDRQAEAVNRLGKEYEELARQQQESTIAAQQTFEYGWNKAFRQYAEDAQNYATVGKDMFEAMTGAMGKAIDQFVDNGKFSFSDFAASVIKDLIKIQLKMAAMKLFEMGFKAVAGAVGGAIGGAGVVSDANAIISGMQSSGVTASVIGSGSLEGGAGAFSYPVAANGGVINSPTLVGERGPEIFMPSRSGTIIPNNNIGDMMGGGGVVYNGTVIQNMTAIDTQSGLQFLAKNKMNIYALNQSASRSMPTSR